MKNEVALKDLLSTTKDGEWGKGEPADGLTEMAVIRGTDFAGVRLGSLHNVPTRYIPEKIAARKRLQPDDILIETAGGSKDRPTGRSVYLKDRIFGLMERPLTCASFSRFLRVDKALAHPEFVYWYLQHLYTSGQMEAHQVQHTGIARFQYTKFAETTIVPLPALEEQHAIAHILGTFDDKIELNRRMNETLEALARALFKSWFVDFDPVRVKMEGRQPPGMDDETAALFPDSFEDSPLGEIPKGWGARALSKVVEVNPRRSLSKGQLAPHLDMKNMPTKGHYPAELTERDFGSGTKFIKGDTLLARITPCLENGKTAFVDFLSDGQVGWGSTEYIILRSKPPLPPEYAYYLARSEPLRTYAIQNMVGSSGRQRVPAQCFDSYFVAVPPEDIAFRFGETVAQLMSKIRSNHEQSRTLAAVRDALLPKLLSGEVRAKEAEEIVEETA